MAQKHGGKQIVWRQIEPLACRKATAARPRQRGGPPRPGGAYCAAGGALAVAGGGTDCQAGGQSGGECPKWPPLAMVGK